MLAKEHDKKYDFFRAFFLLPPKNLDFRATQHKSFDFVDE